MLAGRDDEDVLYERTWVEEELKEEIKVKVRVEDYTVDDLVKIISDRIELKESIIKIKADLYSQKINHKNVEDALILVVQVTKNTH
jgi:hypothetical protein